METSLTSSHPVMIELNRLENKLRDKERELGVASKEIKALKMMELMKDKAMAKISADLLKSNEKLRTTEQQFEEKNLEIKKLRNDKKEALAAQFAAEAALRRVHATQKDAEAAPVEDVVAPLQYEIKLYKDEISVLKENKKVLDRVTKSKDKALAEAEKILCSTLEQALIVENMRNQNLELQRQIAILEEENKLLHKTNHQKVVEVQKLTQSIQELEESLLAASAATNTLCEYRCQVSQLNEEKKALERELAKTKVSANRDAATIANEWKDEDDKAMPVKQSLDERSFLQDEVQLQLEILEESAKHVPSLPTKQAEGSNRVIRVTSRSMGPNRRSVSQPRGSLIGNRLFTQQQANSAFEGANSTINMKQATIPVNHVNGKNMVRRTLSVSRGKFSDDCGKENTRVKANSACNEDEIIFKGVEVHGEDEANKCSDVNSHNSGTTETVSDFLYDRLQKEVISLRKLQELKEGELHAKNDEIKVDALTKVIEAESKNMKRELASRGQELLVVKSDNIKQKNRSASNFKRSIKLPDMSTSSRGA